MALAKNFQDLIICQRGHNLALAIYKVTDSFPDSEKFGLCNQLRRAAVSITSNIAEGFERNSAKNLLYITPKNCDYLINEADEVHKMLNKFRKTLESNELIH